MAKLVGTFEHGYVCESEQDIKKAIEDIVENKYETLDSNIDIMKYSRLNQNRIMEKVLMEVAEGEQR